MWEVNQEKYSYQEKEKNKSKEVKMRKLMIALAICFPLSIFAETKIGYIDSQRILQEYKGRKELEDKFNKKLKEWEDEAKKKKQEIDNLINEFENQSLMLSDEARERKRQEIAQKQKEYEQFVQDIWGPNGKAVQKNQEIMKPFTEKVISIVNRIGEEEGYTIIFDIAPQGIVYAKEGLDLTDRVIEELNAEFAPPAAPTTEKIYMIVFKFKEKNSEAREFGYGKKIAGFLRAGLVMLERFRAEEESRIGLARSQSNIQKKEEDYTIDDAIAIARLTRAKVAVIGEVEKNGDKVDVRCKLIDVERGSLLTQESASTTITESEEDQILQKMMGNVASKFVATWEAGTEK
ncbi:MAG TPA: OmpH family outer membrane protein [bacterium (Candidatus Stahlbacteria)]|nr:OmpH family outer membrane protein [Candidatus Stahlbacteria bacterium]